MNPSYLPQSLSNQVQWLPDHQSSLVIQALESSEVSEWDEDIMKLIENIKSHLKILDETKKEEVINILKHLTGHDLVDINKIV